jgi:alpha-beta hydrolase superfamily lysophospholipase
LFTYFAQQGFVVRGFDYRGHGETIKKRSEDGATKDDVMGHARLDDLWEDALILEELDKRDDEKGLPLFYFGHSLGGLTALGFAKRFYHLEGFKGIIASAPALRFTTPVPGISI